MDSVIGRARISNAVDQDPIFIARQIYNRHGTFFGITHIYFTCVYSVLNVQKVVIFFIKKWAKLFGQISLSCRYIISKIIVAKFRTSKIPGFLDAGKLKKIGLLS